MRVLLIDIDDNRANKLEPIVTWAGMEMLNHRESEEDIYGVMEKLHPEIILIDIQLPDMDGYEICVKLRHNGIPKNTTIITVTSYAMVGDREKSLEAGADGYIEKPINPDTFIAKMEAIHQNKNKK